METTDHTCRMFSEAECHGQKTNQKNQIKCNVSILFVHWKSKKKKKVETTIFKIDDKELCLLLRQNFCNLMSQYKHPQIHVFFNKKEYSSNALNLWKEAWILLISIYQLSKLMRFVFLRISKCLGK